MLRYVGLYSLALLASTAGAVGAGPGTIGGQQPAAEPPKAVSLVSTTTNAAGKNILADSFGRTLYVFDVDKGKPTSACNGGCAEIWPPYLLSDAEAAALKAPLGKITRTSAQIQLTYEGRPIYTYAPDRTVGDDLGDGVGSVWHDIEVKKEGGK